MKKKECQGEVFVKNRIVATSQIHWRYVMKFRELPKKWKTIMITLSMTTLLSLIGLIAYIANTAGSLLHVMIG